jgi:hypothetical protein
MQSPYCLRPLPLCRSLRPPLVVLARLPMRGTLVVPRKLSRGKGKGSDTHPALPQADPYLLLSPPQLAASSFGNCRRTGFPHLALRHIESTAAALKLSSCLCLMAVELAATPARSRSGRKRRIRSKCFLQTYLDPVLQKQRASLKFTEG